MATFVLVHGACHGGWCWQRVSPLLRAAGHEVHTPTLTGLGERAHLLGPAVNLSTHIEDVAGLLFYEDLTGVVLVGHSYAGMVITGVAERVPERLHRLVFLDALLPDDGQSFYDTEYENDPGMRERWTAGAIELRGALAFPGSPEIVDQYLAAFHITDPPDVAWVRPRFTPHPLASAEEPLRAPEYRAAQIPRSYIRCGGPSQQPTSLGAHAKKARARGFDYHELATGHDAMVTAPRELAALLIEIAWQGTKEVPNGPAA
ncbi:MAG TPA: alpha/beta fold hydrolase [Thermomicrobiaceae bacterium]|nr:alpha/beta fold hydrolase [Thermomicrobiaceae bacterium]